MSGSVGFLGTGVRWTQEPIQKTVRGYGGIGWPTHHNGPMKRSNPGARKIRTRIIRDDRLLLVAPEDVLEDDEILGTETVWVDAYVERDELEEGSYEDGEITDDIVVMEAPHGELGYSVAGYLEAPAE